MNVGIARLYLRLPESRSLKTRRQAARSLTQRVRARFNVSVAQDAEADGNAWQSLTLLISCVSNDAGYIDSHARGSDRLRRKLPPRPGTGGLRIRNHPGHLTPQNKRDDHPWSPPVVGRCRRLNPIVDGCHQVL